MRNIILALSLTASSAAALPADGLYFSDFSTMEEGCTQFGMSDATIEVSGNRITFFETVCTLSNPQGIGDMPAMLYQASCNMEGEMSQEPMIIYDVFDGIAILHAGSARTYLRCE